IGLQIPRPRNSRLVIPLGSWNSSDSIATFGRKPCPRTTSLPFSTPNFMCLTLPSAASTATDVIGEPCTSSVYFGMTGMFPCCRSASIARWPSFTSLPMFSSIWDVDGRADIGDAEAFGTYGAGAIDGDAEASGAYGAGVAGGAWAWGRAAVTRSPRTSGPGRMSGFLHRVSPEESVYDGRAFACR